MMRSDSVEKTEQSPYKEASLHSMYKNTEWATPADSKPDVAGGRAQGAQPAGSWEMLWGDSYGEILSV